MTVALLFALCAVFVSDTFETDATQLQITPTGTAQSADELERSAGNLPTKAQIDADGYDTTLASGFEKVLEDEKSALHFNSKTAEVALEDKQTGQIWYSNPQDRDLETMVDGTTRLRIGAQLTVTYYDQKGAYGLMDSYNDSIAYDGMTYEVAGSELLVTYKLGKTTVTLSDVPQQISKSRMEQFAAALSEDDREDLLKNYRLVSIAGKEDDKEYVENLVKKYPNVVNEDTYYLAKDSSRILKKVKAYMDQCGYTYDDLDYDNTVNQVETEETSRAHFKMTLSYHLDDGALVAALKGDSLEYDEKIPPNEIRILEYFGAGGQAEQGYMLVPDGSGTLIYYNNGKTSETVFSMRLYGADTVSDTESAYVADRKASLPAFGIKNGKAALLITVDRGAELCTLNARVAGMTNSYNTVYVSAITTAVDFMEISDSRQIYFEEAPYRGDLVLRYQPLAEANNDYMGMARTYRARLLDQGILTQTAEESYAVAADIIGAVPTTDIVAGLPIETMEAMTTFAQTQEIAEELDDLADEVWLRLEGWQKGGIRQSAQTSLRAESSLRGKSGLSELIEAAQTNGWVLMPEVFLSTDLAGESLTIRQYAARDLCRDVAVRYDYDYVSRYRRYNGHAIIQLTAARFQKQTKRYAQDAAKIGLLQTAIADIGTDLWSDFTRKNPMNRVAMAEAQAQALSVLAEQAEISLRNPNYYALAYAKRIYDMPCSDSAFRLTDESVPFYQAVIRGSIAYVSEPINYQDDVWMAYLQAVEFGAGLQYTLTYETTALLKETDYSWINRGRYADWRETIALQCEKAREVLSPLAGQAMTDHERIAFNVYKTTYESGNAVVVNYSDAEVSVDGVAVPAMDFVLIKAGES